MSRLYVCHAGGERVRWTQTVADLTVAVDNCIGDILISAGFISYLGPFTAEFRQDVGDSWRNRLVEFSIQHTPGCDITQTLVEPVKLRIWQMYGLPTDPLSTQNGIMLDRARRWSLFIDPQGQVCSRRPGVLGWFPFVDMSRLRERWSWVVSFLLKRPFGRDRDAPRRSAAWPRPRRARSCAAPSEKCRASLI